jgi:hypothetical protein
MYYIFLFALASTAVTTISAVLTRYTPTFPVLNPLYEHVPKLVTIIQQSSHMYFRYLVFIICIMHLHLL